MNDGQSTRSGTHLQEDRVLSNNRLLSVELMLLLFCHVCHTYIQRDIGGFESNRFIL